ncbi:MAG: hypothetical protein RR791_01140 [Lachnospiraceae bacterium]
MNIKSFYKYQLHNYIHSLLWYYIVLQPVMFMFLRMVLLDHNIQGNGIEMSALIFLFICGQYFFQTDFYFGLQNGVSRKTMMVSLGLINLTVATGMAIMDVILLGGLFGMGVSLNSVSDKIFLGVGNISFFGLLYQTSLNIMITMLSSFIAIVYEVWFRSWYTNTIVYCISHSGSNVCKGSSYEISFFSVDTYLWTWNRTKRGAHLSVHWIFGCKWCLIIIIMGVAEENTHEGLINIVLF